MEINYVGLIADDIDKQVLGLVAFVFFFLLNSLEFSA